MGGSGGGCRCRRFCPSGTPAASKPIRRELCPGAAATIPRPAPARNRGPKIGAHRARRHLAGARPALLKDLDTLEQLARSLKQGWEPELTLVVDAAFPRATLLGIVAELQQSCPSTQVHLADVVLSGAEEAIIGALADVVVTSRVPAGFLGDWLLDVVFTAVARPGHPLLQLGRELTTDDLVRHVQAVVRDSGTAHPRDEGWLGAARRFTVSSMEASLATLLAGLAFAWLPEHLLADRLKSGELRRLPLVTGGSRTVSLHIVLARPDLLGPAGARGGRRISSARAPTVGRSLHMGHEPA